MNNTYQILKRKAASKFNQIIGDQNTFCKIKPNQEDMQMLKSIATELITSDPKTQPTQFLWEANCAIYSVAYTWKTNIKRLVLFNKIEINSDQNGRKTLNHKWIY